jgi:2-oxoglutarate ferredoxin oxidoreductase subunit beta
MNKTMPICWNILSKPHLFCPGCGHGISLKQIGFAIDELKIQKKTTFGIDIGCSLLAWNFFDLDIIQTHHGRTTAVMVGYKMVKPERIAIAYMGDGGGYAIGLQSLLHAALRNEPITVILINNENYAMTGGQSAPTTLIGEVTSTTPEGKSKEFGSGFQGPELIRKISNKDAFIARTSVSQPEIVKRTIISALKNQIEKNSFSFVEILSICPTNWKTNAAQSFNRLAEAEKYYQIGEIK